MKRFWLVLLSLGLVLAFSASAMAVDVKFSGSFYVAGMYQDKTTFMKDTASDGPSTAFYYQRLRLQTDFIVSPGLKLVTRFDAMERAWGASRTTPGTALDSMSAGTKAENENIAFDLGYVEYASPIGIFAAGFMLDGGWGTVFGNGLTPVSKITYTLPIGGWTLLAQLVKASENSVTAKNPISATNLGYADADSDKAYLMGIYSWEGGQAGVLGVYGRDASKRPDLLGAYKSQYYILEPMVMVQLGPVKLQAEVDYAWGDLQAFDNGVGNRSISSLMGWIDATATFSPVYFGGTLAYVSGDDPGTKDKVEGYLTGGNDFNPCLIMFNYDRYYWAGAIPGYPGTQNAAPMSNAWFGQGKVGVRPIPPLDIMASLSYAQADQKPAGVLNNAYGWEVDVTGTYKITNNLAYMLGLGYLFTGDYYKGATENSVRDNYLLINKLTLTF